MKASRLFWLIPLAGLLAMPAYAGPRDHGQSRFEHRIERQQDRIRHGVRNGELTHREAKKLQRQNQRIARAERRFTRDGVLDRGERRQLRNKLDRASDRIATFKHNDRRRATRGGDHWAYLPDRHGPRHGHRHHYRSGPPRYGHVDPHWSLVFSLSDNW
jgi:hypothetical protein